MPKRKGVVVAGDRETERFVAIMRYGFGKMEMGDWGLKDWQFELATRCLVFKELMRQAHEHELAGTLREAPKTPIVLMHADGTSPPREPFVPECWVDVSRLFAVARRPDPPSFPEWWGSNETRPDWWAAEDRGEAGWFADWDTAAWYAHELDPENFGIEEACELLY